MSVAIITAVRIYIYMNKSNDKRRHVVKVRKRLMIIISLTRCHSWTIKTALGDNKEILKIQNIFFDLIKAVSHRCLIFDNTYKMYTVGATIIRSITTVNVLFLTFILCIFDRVMFVSCMYKGHCFHFDYLSFIDLPWECGRVVLFVSLSLEQWAFAT